MQLLARRETQFRMLAQVLVERRRAALLRAGNDEAHLVSARHQSYEPVGLATAALWEAVLAAGRAAVPVHCKRPATTECPQVKTSPDEERSTFAILYADPYKFGNCLPRESYLLSR